jgi:hypothetical protein
MIPIFTAISLFSLLGASALLQPQACTITDYMKKTKKGEGPFETFPLNAFYVLQKVAGTG